MDASITDSIMPFIELGIQIGRDALTGDRISNERR